MNRRSLLGLIVAAPWVITQSAKGEVLRLAPGIYTAI